MSSDALFLRLSTPQSLKNQLLTEYMRASRHLSLLLETVFIFSVCNGHYHALSTRACSRHMHPSVNRSCQSAHSATTACCWFPKLYLLFKFGLYNAEDMTRRTYNLSRLNFQFFTSPQPQNSSHMPIAKLISLDHCT